MTVQEQEQRLLDTLGGVSLRLEQLSVNVDFVTPRGGFSSWLGDHQDEAAELAALLHEAAPKLALAGLRGAPTRASSAGSSRTPALPKARSYELTDTTRDRLRAAVPLPTGPGQVDWSKLVAAISSELLSFDEAPDPAAFIASPRAAAAAAQDAAQPAAAGLQHQSSLASQIGSPRSASAGGERLDINSGGRVIFCLFAPESSAPTPPCSLRNSPEKEAAGWMRRGAAQRAPPTSPIRSSGNSSAGGAAGEAAAGQAAAGETQEQRAPPRSRGTAPGLPRIPSSASTASSRSSLEGADLLPCASQELSDDGASATAYALQRSGGSFSFAPLPCLGPSGAAAEEDGPPSPPPLRRLPSVPQPEGCLVLKFVSSRLICQSEQFASELTRHVGLCVPESRILRQQGASEAEWRAAADASAALRDRFPDLHEEMSRNSCCLVMEFVPGESLFKCLHALAASASASAPASAPGALSSAAASAPGQLTSAASAPAALAVSTDPAAGVGGQGSSSGECSSSGGSSTSSRSSSGGSGSSGSSSSSSGSTGSLLVATAEDLGRLFTLDMLLGNADRLPCQELGWRGNPGNVLFASGGRWAGRAVAIDAVVQRRPPGGLMSQEDGACERLAELALNDADVAGALLRQALAPCSSALAAVDPKLMQAAAAAFQQGLKAALEAAASIKGLLEMMFEVVTDWIEEFIEDIELASSGGAAAQTTPRSAGASRRASSAGAASPLLLTACAATSAQTMRIRQINHEAARNDSVGERVAHWKAVFREKGEELRAAVEEWQLKRGSPGGGGQRLTTAFLDGTHPVVDVYELKVRLEHMLQRLRVLQQASLTGRPVRLLPRLYLSGAVEASSLHLLRHLGITHVLNATEDLLLPEEGQGFVTHRVPLRDVEEEDLAPHLPDASAFIDTGLASGGGVLVHCHAGKSRSCSLVLAWLMTRRRWPLNRAMEFLRRVRPEAEPNAGYLKALLQLEEELFGRQTVKMKKTKPEPRCCPECGERVGLSADSVRVHIRLKHPASALARELGSGSWAELPSPSTTISSSGLPSPKAPPPAQSSQHPPQQPAAAGEQQQGVAVAAAAPAAAGMPIGTTQAGGLAAVHTRATLADEAAAAGEALPDSPPSMAAVLRAEAGELSLTELPADEFLLAEGRLPVAEQQL